MNLIEAMKTGRPFIRESWAPEYWVIPHPHQSYDKFVWNTPKEFPMTMNPSDVLAEDWKVQNIIEIPSKESVMIGNFKLTNLSGKTIYTDGIIERANNKA